MSTQTFVLPDVGEGLTEAEIVTWKVAPGDAVQVVLGTGETAAGALSGDFCCFSR